jgi:predicted SAM-dependent methyltransferase
MILRLDAERARKVFGSRGAADHEVRLALAFKSPKDADRLVGEEFAETFDDGVTDRHALRQTVERLTAEGVLVAVPETDDQADDARFASELASSARQLEAIAGDLAAMGRWAGDHVRVDGDDPVAVLGAVRTRLTSLRNALADARGPFIASQRNGATAPTCATAPTSPLRLHLGCGAARVPGWINIDLAGGDLRLNLGWSLPFADSSVSCVYSAHTLEHLHYHTAAPRLLKEIHRVLAPTGRVRLAVPDLEAYSRAYAESNQTFFREYDRARPEFGTVAGYPTPLSKVMMMAGSALRSGSFFEHKMGYDFETLAALLRNAGFEAIERSRFGGSGHESLVTMDETSTAAGLSYEDVANTLFVEATK